MIAGSISGLPMLEQLGGLDRFDVPAAASSSTTSSSISESARALVPPGLRGGAGTLSVSHQAFKDKVLRETDGYQEADNGDLVMSPLDIWSLIIYTCPADLLDLLIRQYLTKSEVLYRKLESLHEWLFFETCSDIPALSYPSPPFLSQNLRRNQRVQWLRTCRLFGCFRWTDHGDVLCSVPSDS